MFKNPGGSLKTYGKIVFIAGVILSVFTGISIWITTIEKLGIWGFFIGFFTIAAGIFFSYLLTIFVIAFGELVENSTAIRNMMEKGQTMPDIPQKTENIPVKQPEVKPYVQPQKIVDLHKDSDTVAICPFCGKDNKMNANFCRNCGKKLE